MNIKRHSTLLSISIRCHNPLEFEAHQVSNPAICCRATRHGNILSFDNSEMIEGIVSGGVILTDTEQHELDRMILLQSDPIPVFNLR